MKKLDFSKIKGIQTPTSNPAVVSCVPQEIKELQIPVEKEEIEMKQPPPSVKKEILKGFLFVNFSTPEKLDRFGEVIPSENHQFLARENGEMFAITKEDNLLEGLYSCDVEIAEGNETPINLKKIEGETLTAWGHEFTLPPVVPTLTIKRNDLFKEKKRLFEEWHYNLMNQKGVAKALSWIQGNFFIEIFPHLQNWNGEGKFKFPIFGVVIEIILKEGDYRISLKKTEDRKSLVLFRLSQSHNLLICNASFGSKQDQKPSISPCYQREESFFSQGTALGFFSEGGLKSF